MGLGNRPLLLLPPAQKCPLPTLPLGSDVPNEWGSLDAARLWGGEASPEIYGQSWLILGYPFFCFSYLPAKAQQRTISRNTPFSFFLPSLLFSSFVMWEEYCCCRCLFLLLLFRKKLSADLAANSNSRVLCMHGTGENRTIHAQILRTHELRPRAYANVASFRLLSLFV